MAQAPGCGSARRVSQPSRPQGRHPPLSPANPQIAGISKVYPPHSLRQPFATQRLNAGASLEGKADTERVMRTLKEEYLWLNEWTSPFEVSRALEIWITDYNEHYLHSSLGYRTPRQFELEYQCSHRSAFLAA